MVNHEKEQLVKRDKYGEEKSVFIFDYLVCCGCGVAIVMADRGSRWRDIDKSYLHHVKNCFALKRLLIMERHKASHRQIESWLNTKTKRIMAEPKNESGGTILKRDLIQCPQCKLEQLALVIEVSKDEVILEHECRLCQHKFTEEEFARNVVIQDFDNAKE